MGITASRESKGHQSHQALPADAQKTIEDITRQHNGDKRGNGYLLRVQQVEKSDLGVSKSLEPLYKSWTDPDGFFDQSARLRAGCAVSQVYEQLRHIGQRNVDDPIRSRLLSVALCGLRCLVDEEFPPHRLNDVSLLRPDVKEYIARIIPDSPIVNDSYEEVVKWVELYIKFGQRMKIIAERNGGLGALVVIPSWLLSLRQWAKELNAADFEQALRHLRSIGVADIARETGAHAVANRIHGFILEKFTSSIVSDRAADTTKHGHPMNNHRHIIHQDSMADEESTDDEMLDNNGSSADDDSTHSNATSPCSSACDYSLSSHQD
ncbi:MAG: hypothetical protein M1812_005798 [Candelaria pacifica]|nr:MAG: hypothetical protein M1812_005798 [Candelaria pacifica]